MGKNTFEIEFAGITARRSIYIKKPEILDGFWSVPKTGTGLVEAYYGEKVKFIVGTKDIDDDTILNFILYDYDGKYNPADELSRSFSAKVKGNLAELELVPDIKWDESAKYEFDRVVETYFKVETEINGKKISAKLPKKEEEYLKLYTPKVTLTIIIELPMKNFDDTDMSTQEIAAAKLGLLGHTAIAIDDDFYDYGPEKDPRILGGTIDESKYGDINNDGDASDTFSSILDPDLKDSGLNQTAGDPLGTLGRPWWDKQFTSGKADASLSDIMSILNDETNREIHNLLGETHILELDVTEQEAKVVKDWWENKYNNDLGIYSINIMENGSHCTSTVRDSLIEAKILERSYTLCIPRTLLNQVQFLRHSAGKERGKVIRKRILKDISK